MLCTLNKMSADYILKSFYSQKIGLVNSFEFFLSRQLARCDCQAMFFGSTSISFYRLLIHFWRAKTKLQINGIFKLLLLLHQNILCGYSSEFTVISEAIPVNSGEYPQHILWVLPGIHQNYRGNSGEVWWVPTRYVTVQKNILNYHLLSLTWSHGNEFVQFIWLEIASCKYVMKHSSTLHIY